MRERKEEPPKTKARKRKKEPPGDEGRRRSGRTNATSPSYTKKRRVPRTRGAHALT